MAQALKVLGQSYPTLATATKIYTAPALTSTAISTISIVNQSATTVDTVRISIRVAGAADATKQYIYYNLAMPAETTFAATFGITLAASDEVWVYSTNGTCSFNLFGTENT